MGLGLSVNSISRQKFLYYSFDVHSTMIQKVAFCMFSSTKPGFIGLLQFFCFCLFLLQFEMLTGALPFQGKDRKETMNLILKQESSGTHWCLVAVLLTWTSFHVIGCTSRPTTEYVLTVLCLPLQGAPGNASVPEHRSPVTPQGSVQEEPSQPTRSLSTAQHVV